MKFEIKREDVLRACEQMLGLPFVHQGRSLQSGVDCVGLLVVMGRLIGYPDIVDVEGYRRIPKSSVIRATLAENLDEIPLADARPADVFLMRQGGLLPRHAAIYYSDALDIANGIEPMILHAVKSGVVLEPKSSYVPSWYVSAFRLRGLVD